MFDSIVRLYENVKKVGEYIYDQYIPKYQPVTGYSDNNMENWAYHSEQWDDKDFDAFAVLYNLPVVQNYLDYLYDKRAGEEYKRNYGIDKVHDPRRLPGATSSIVSVGVGALNYVSHNVARLYR